jgi:CRISPR-associated endonuclease Csn1
VENASPGEFVLGLDLGTNSLGWAIIGLVDGEPHHLVRAGVRVFDAGMEGNLESGREESRNLKRRQMRSQRRQTWRRARRLRKIFNLLQRYELLPGDHAASSEERQDFLNRLDREILASQWFIAKAKSGAFPEPLQTMPYILRAAALDEKLEPHFLGRALYHLAQRRGFSSNRKQAPKKDDDEGKVKEGIAELRKAMQEKGARTLGEYFSRLAPSQERIRSRWTSRDMYEKEFEAIWSVQAKYQPRLFTDDRKKELRNAIFFQRPLWFDPNTIGKCGLEKAERRAPAHLLPSQRFRLLDKANNLEINGARLTAADRAKLIQELELHGDMTFKKFRKLLGITNDDEINLERGGEKKLPGNRTFAQFHEALGQHWLDFSPAERDRLVQYVYAFQKPDKLAEAAKKKWNINADTAEKLANISFEPDYFSHSARAMQKLLPLLEQGKTYGEARKIAYPESFESTEPKPLLPAVQEALAEIRNPAVMRSLTELRKVVNAILRQHGKPTHIRIELARDLKKSKKQRAAISESNRRNEASRAKSTEEIVKAQVGIKEPKPWDVRKAQLWNECGGVCPYTGKHILFKALFGPEPQFDIEHIIPFSISMDNSFQNLTLCYVPENRSAKGNKTPHQAYSGAPVRYAAILDRVKYFKGERAITSAKLKRFEMDDEKLENFLADFRDRQLNDTAYASSLAARYLGLLYGGLNDATGAKRVHATSGGATAYFRSLWHLNEILSEAPTANGGRAEKKRADHRHHAIDALVIGLTDAGMIKRLADAAQRAPAEHRRKFGSLQGPWPGFVDSVRAEVDKIVVSRRVSKKVSGALHEETIYSAAKADGKVRVRKSLAAMTKNEADNIADPAVKALVAAKLNGGEPKKVFSNGENMPFFEASDGRRIPIKRVRVNKAVPTFALGGPRSARHVASESNHHIEIFAELDAEGKEVQWEGKVAPLAQAYRRNQERLPVVQRDCGPRQKFKFSLASGEVIECDIKPCQRALYVVRKMSQQSSGGIQIGLAPLNDARQAKVMQASRAWLWSTPDKLRQRNTRKVLVTPLGETSDAHD